MNIEAALISFELKGNKKTYATSGILFDRKTALLTGTSFFPFLQQKKWISHLVKTASSELKTNEYLEKVFFRVFVNTKNHNKNDKVFKNFDELESRVVGFWKCPFVSATKKKFFSRDWNFGQVNVENGSTVLSSDVIDLSKELMSIFILVKCKDRGNVEEIKENSKSDDHIRVLLNLMLSLQEPRRGQEIEIVSTPFGNEYFMNSLSCGVISNVIGCEKCIILTDARTVSGCEGGPIFIALKSRKEEKPKLLGIVTCPLTLWRGEWVGLSIGVSLVPVLKRLLNIKSNSNYPEPFDDISRISSDLLPVNFIDETLVLIRSQTSWGSGVILNDISGVIITCSHVVKDDNVVSVFQKGNHYTANVVFKSQCNIAYDLAILKVIDNFLFTKKANFLTKNLAKIGEPVIAAGFPLFSERDDVSIRPTIVTGCVAQVNPYMIQTTCCIQSGISGGAVFRRGELLGIIISTAKNSTSGALFPHINFIVPCSVFREPVMKYMKTNSVETLKTLECSDVQVQVLWNLQTSKL